MWFPVFSTWLTDAVNIDSGKSAAEQLFDSKELFFSSCAAARYKVFLSTCAAREDVASQDNPTLGALLVAFLLYSGNDQVQRVMERAATEVAQQCESLFRSRFGDYAQRVDAASLALMRDQKQGVQVDRSIWVAAVQAVQAREKRTLEQALETFNCSKTLAVPIYKARFCWGL